VAAPSYSGTVLFFAGGIVGMVAIAFWLFSLFDALTAPADQIRGMQKALWVLVVLLLLDIGAVLWWLFGRPRAGVAGLEQRDRRTDPWGGAFERPNRPTRPTSARRTLAPDDDIEFLRSLDQHRGDDGPTPAR
jgi:hypothetical protein